MSLIGSPLTYGLETKSVEGGVGNENAKSRED